MPTLNKFITDLQKLQAEGHGEKQVFYRHGSSGDCGKLSSARVTGEVDECGPFDLDDGDCARMEAEVGIDVEWHRLGVKCSKFSGGSSPDVIERETFRDHGDDRQAARRLASLRVAAAVGRAMP